MLLLSRSIVASENTRASVVTSNTSGLSFTAATPLFTFQSKSYVYLISESCYVISRFDQIKTTLCNCKKPFNGVTYYQDLTSGGLLVDYIYSVTRQLLCSAHQLLCSASMHTIVGDTLMSRHPLISRAKRKYWNNYGVFLFSNTASKQLTPSIIMVISSAKSIKNKHPNKTKDDQISSFPFHAGQSSPRFEMGVSIQLHVFKRKGRRRV